MIAQEQRRFATSEIGTAVDRTDVEDPGPSASFAHSDWMASGQR
jgi:hypothetical protein